MAATSLPLSLPRRQRLSPTAVKRQVTIGQRWTSLDGEVWRVAQVYRADAIVLLQRPGQRALCRVSFAALGRYYRPSTPEGEAV
jgi:hypothetical protein